MVRPIAGGLAVLGLGRSPRRDRAAISFYSVRGIATFYYLAYALEQTEFVGTEELWAVAGLIVLLSVVIHDITAAPVLEKLDELREEREDATRPVAPGQHRGGRRDVVIAPAAARTVVLVRLLLLVSACDHIQNPVLGEEEPGLVEVRVDERCEDVPDDVLTAIEDGLHRDAALAGAHAVGSEEEDEVTFVAAELGSEGHPQEPPIGMWAVRGDLLRGDAEIFAVKAIAREHSAWPFDEAITEQVDGGEEAHACVDGAAQ